MFIEPRDFYTLWESMKKHSRPEFPLDSSFDPYLALPSTVTRADAFEWGGKLLNALNAWKTVRNSPFDEVVYDLGESFKARLNNRPKRRSLVTKVVAILELLNQLHARCALPAIVLNHDRNYVENKCRGVLRELEKAEALQKREAFSARSIGHTAKHHSKPRTRFSPPLDGFHFADKNAVPFEDICTHCDELQRFGVDQWIIDALIRGLAIHHAGMDYRYQTSVEILFARGYIRVVFATGTTNLQCRTLVFSGNSELLSTFSFRQSVSCAGRTGLDVLGNIIFHDISASKIYGLLCSRPSNHDFHFPVSNTLVLRLCTLLHESNYSKLTVLAVDSILSPHPNRSDLQQMVEHHLRFAIGYLHQARLIDLSGAPINFAGCISHLYFIEKSSMAFHRLLNQGYFHRLCADIDTNSTAVLQTLLVVLSRVFARDSDRSAGKSSTDVSPVALPLPPFPEEAARILQDHNASVLKSFVGCLDAYIRRQPKKPRYVLPLSKVSFGREEDSCAPGLGPVVRSPFVALSGHGDCFASVPELAESVHSWICFEQSVIPQFDVDPKTPLNSCKAIIKNCAH